jgi:predicted KAP-like P-loop ATPase
LGCNQRVTLKWWQNMRPTLRKYIPLVGISSVIAAIGWADKSQFLPVAGITGLAGSLVAAGLQVFQQHSKAASSVDDEPQESLGEYAEVLDYDNASVAMSNVIEDIQTVLKRIPRMYLPIIIFVDDLDRCSPTKVTNIIEAINLFLGGGYFTDSMFILGMDAQMVAAALEESYSKIISRLPQDPLYRATGWKFMDKFVQLPFIIPPPESNGISTYVDKLLLLERVDKTTQLQIKQAAEEVAKQTTNEKLKADETTDVEERKRKKDETKRIASTIANEQGLNSRQEHELLEHEVKAKEDLTDLDKKLEKYSDEDPFIKKLILEAAPDFLGNPREIKRFMNVLRFQYFMLSAREAQGLEIPLLEHVSRWIVLSLKWLTISRWVKGNKARLLQLEGMARESSNNDEWKKRIEVEGSIKADAIPEIFDEPIFRFFKNEVDKKDRQPLSYSAGKGLF